MELFLEKKNFLKLWFSGLMESLEKMNDEMWPRVLEMTGRACARVHAVDLFKKVWKDSGDLTEFIHKINNSLGEEVFKRIGEDEIEVTYKECYCPLVQLDLVSSPILCNCSPNWLTENFETILDKTVNITTKHTILHGADTCKFTISFD